MGFASEEVRTKLSGHEIIVCYSGSAFPSPRTETRLYIDGRLIDSTSQLNSRFGPKGPIEIEGKVKTLEVFLGGAPFFRRLVIKVDGQEIARSSG